MSSNIALLRNVKFLPLFLTQFLGAFNDSVFKNAILIWVLYGSEIHQVNLNFSMLGGITAGLFVLPFFLFSVLAGQLADKYERSRVVRFLKILEILLMLFAYYTFQSGNLYLLLVILFLLGVQSTFFGPIKYSLLPTHLQEKDLIAANGLMDCSTFVAILIGSLSGSIIVINYGLEIMFALIMFCSILGYFSSCYIPKAKVTAPDLKLSRNIFTSTYRALGSAKKDKNTWLPTLGIAWFWFIGALFLSHFPIYVREVIRGNGEIINFFFLVFSVGVCIGSLLCSKLLKGKVTIKLLPSSSIFMTVFIFLFSYFSFLYIDNRANQVIEYVGLVEFLSGINSYISWNITISLLLLSMAGGIFVVPLYSLLQVQAEEACVSRTIAVNNIVTSFFIVSSSLIALTMLYLSFSILSIMLIIGVMNIPVTLFITKTTEKNLNVDNAAAS